MGASGGYRFLEHVTDAFVEAWGETMEEAFSQAGLALFETMLDRGTVEAKTSERVDAEGHDEKELLYNYLEALLLVFEIKQLAVKRISVYAIETIGNTIRLSGKVAGERYDPTRHVGKVEVKGITYHQMEIQRRARKVVVHFLLDL